MTTDGRRTAAIEALAERLFVAAWANLEHRDSGAGFPPEGLVYWLRSTAQLSHEAALIFVSTREERKQS